jgi:hypothetical protein
VPGTIAAVVGDDGVFHFNWRVDAQPSSRCSILIRRVSPAATVIGAP